MGKSTYNSGRNQNRAFGLARLSSFPIRTFLLLLATLFAIIIPYCLFGDAIHAWTDQRLQHAASHRLYTGTALILLLAVDILMPVPSSLVSTACGVTLGFAGGTVASFAGMSLSATAGYFMGRTASPAIVRMIGAKELALLKTFQKRHGAWMLLALRPVPVLAEASVVFSGLARLPLPGVLLATTLGNLAVSLTYAAIGAWGKVSDSFLPAFGASILLSGLFMLSLRRKGLLAPTCPASK